MGDVNIVINEDGSLSYAPIVEATLDAGESIQGAHVDVDVAVETPDQAPQAPDAYCIICRKGIRMLVDPWSSAEESNSKTSHTKMSQFIIEFLDSGTTLSLKVCIEFLHQFVMLSCVYIIWECFFLIILM